MREIYLHAKTTRSLRLAGEELDELYYATTELPTPEMLGYDVNRPLWRDGLSLRWRVNAEIDDVVAELRPALETFADWAVTDREGCRRSPREELFGNGHAESPSPFSQIFLVDRRRRPDDRMAAFKDILPGAVSSELMLTDGAVLSFGSPEPCGVTRRRAFGALKQVDAWAICDASGWFVSGPDIGVAWIEQRMEELDCGALND
ncbi:MAG TPA: hypothetical protein VNQ56_12955 [Pseudolabrys sp.]|nr:hypothetical protein [Pseudolabrys sp.]